MDFSRGQIKGALILLSLILVIALVRYLAG